eukprot:TRINITY_DN859_c0_g1_i2.p1 TRINITY_DN859_c0_g1~~TRINITY_DN859_c0_g1_i2.p1  ORF type:complete len:226 (-),score=21.23 TRINITY_DN859_c0_g1_i2:93-770(-)
MKLRVALSVILFGFFSYTVLATTGIDISIWSKPTLSQWQCLQQLGNTFAIIEVWNGGHQLNANTPTNVQNAWDAGFKYVDLYAFFCPNCNGNYPAFSAIDSIAQFVKNQKIKYGMLWIDVEPCEGCWSNDPEYNLNYVVQLVQEAKTQGLHVGIYSSWGSWDATIGLNRGSPVLQNLPLWYAHYDGVPSFADGLYTFGGWTQPAIKQFKGDQTQCGVDVDNSWYP